MAFRGHFDYSLDAKNRLNVPPKFRAAFSDGMVLVRGLEPCVWLWPPAAFESFTKQVLAHLNPVSAERRMLTRFVAGQSFDGELDAAGRITVNPPLIEHAGIDKEVVVVGVLDYLEVWSRGRWLAGQDELSAEVEKIVEGLGHPA